MTTQFDATAEERRTARSHLRTLANLAGYLWPPGRRDLRIRALIALACLAGAKAVNVYVPMLYKYAVDALTPGQVGADGAGQIVSIPLALILAYGGARLLTQAFGELRDFFFARSQQHAQRSVALQTFRHLHGLPLAFHLERQTGGLSRVIERGVRAIQFVLSFMIFNILPTLLEIGLVTGVLWYALGWPYALSVFSTIVIYIAFTMAVTDWRLKYRRRMNETDSRANNRAIDSLLNYETVKYFSAEEHEHNRYDRSLAAYETAAVKSQTSLSLLNIGQGAIIGVGLIVTMYIAAADVVAERSSVGDFVLVNTYLIQLYLPLNFLGFVYREIKQGLIDMDKMFELLDVQSDVQDAPDAEPLRVGRGEVEFDSVGFAYKSDREIIRDLSFRVPAGRTTAIVGPSGAGKSTISRLLFRFYDASAGAIRIDGQDIRSVTQDSLRQAIGIVPQDTVLFNDTIGYNIRYGRPDASDEEMIAAAKLARIHGFIESLPDGYETTVGERGLKLSGGEKQRVAIARTILKRPAILLFDEATSALDSHTEKEIQASLREVSKDRTTLVIAHRLSTIVDADEILVLRDGSIAERGTHRELLAREGEYAAMWKRQQEAAQLEAEMRALEADPAVPTPRDRPPTAQSACS